MPKQIGDNRSFTVERSTFNENQEVIKSRYIGKIPSGAAKKAARVLFRTNDKKGKGDTVFIQMRETTRNSRDATFFYKATKQKVDKKRKVGDKEIKITSEITVKSIGPEEFEEAMKKKTKK